MEIQTARRSNLAHFLNVPVSSRAVYSAGHEYVIENEWNCLDRRDVPIDFGVLQCRDSNAFCSFLDQRGIDRPHAQAAPTRLHRGGRSGLQADAAISGFLAG
jgi:hypothetical protein